MQGEKIRWEPPKGVNIGLTAEERVVCRVAFGTLAVVPCVFGAHTFVLVRLCMMYDVYNVIHMYNPTTCRDA